jgi:5-methyltetrahydropteroyltriglutamate--homocysteine methyltransferase
MLSSSERFLTTHTGSLPRPDDLVDLVVRREAGEPVDPSALAARVRTAVADVAQRQVDVGIDLPSDGEFSKPGFNNYVKDRLTGFGGEQTPWRLPEMADFPDFRPFTMLRPGDSAPRSGPVRLAPTCIGPIAPKDPAAVRTDIANLRSALQRLNVAEAFMTAASPGSVALIINNAYYQTQEAYLFALADAMRDEYRAIVDAGFVLQLDCPDLGMCGHIQYANASLEEFRQAIAVHIEALNHAIQGLPANRIRVHLCWGNYLGPHTRDRPLRDIVDLVLRANVGGISYEASNPRHEHEWRVWQEVSLPPDMVLIPGVIDSHSNYVEHPQVVADRIMRVAQVVGKERVIAGSDCGFGTFAAIRNVAASIAWAKLGSLVEGARLATTQAFGRAAALTA